MKKLVAIAVVFALVVGGVFAVDLGASVFGGIRLLEGNTRDKDRIMGNGKIHRVRLEGAGEDDDGNFGAWLRFDPIENTHISIVGLVSGLVWWKPIDQFKLSIGGNPDGIYGKEGYAGWMFYQIPGDVGIVDPGNMTGDGGYIPYIHWRSMFRRAFYGGFDDNGFMLDIRPLDILGINVALPYITMHGKEVKGPHISMYGKEVKEIFKSVHAQVDLNLDFGNLAITYRGERNVFDPDPTLYAYFGLTVIENLSLDLGFGFELPGEDESDLMSIGLAIKFDVNDLFGFKARFLGEFGNEKADPFVVGIDLLPYINMSDSLKAFISLGLAMDVPDEGDSSMGWHLNPYLQVGSEWSPAFYFGVRVWSTGGNDDRTHFEVPFGIQISY